MTRRPPRSTRTATRFPYTTLVRSVGLEPKDFDVATNATPNQIRPLFRRARIIGKRFQLVHVVFGQEIIETSTFRANAGSDGAVQLGGEAQCSQQDRKSTRLNSSH